ncbi:hypothetical protein EVAR_101159_1 [Eumeta japonica]|uniref:Uncharacterized protein n=1 Tax=Eumeta variegata TaxID=151549 RepID=A0A4C1TU17_EUMVA|nr:hypothetical protein EVAR_101159_1 [Eumeta japonica]
MPFALPSVSLALRRANHASGSACLSLALIVSATTSGVATAGALGTELFQLDLDAELLLRPFLLTCSSRDDDASREYLKYSQTYFAQREKIGSNLSKSKA